MILTYTRINFLLKYLPWIVLWMNFDYSLKTFKNVNLISDELSYYIRINWNIIPNIITETYRKIKENNKNNKNNK